MFFALVLALFSLINFTPITFSPGTTIKSSDMNSNFSQLVTVTGQVNNILQQPSGGTDPGTYTIVGWGNASGDNLQAYIPSRSRNATPVSITLGTVFDGPSDVTTPTGVTTLDSNGVRFYVTTTAANVYCHVGQYFTWQY